MGVTRPSAPPAPGALKCARHASKQGRGSSKPTACGILLLLAFLLSCIQFAFGLDSNSNEPGVQTPFFLEQDTLQLCKDDLAVANVDMDGELNSTEFLTFLDLFSNGAIVVSTFVDVPLRISMIYNWAACLCTSQANLDPQCCIGDNAHVNLSFDEEEEGDMYLFVFCSQIEGAIMDVLTETESPTGVPSASPSRKVEPTVTSEPTSSPSDLTKPPSSPATPAIRTPRPTPRPVKTAEPSAQPTSSVPTFLPTSPPIDTEAPSAKPISPPTSPPIDTLTPSLSPTFLPTSSPIDTEAPSNAPSPTSLPTAPPIDTETPTQTPSLSPTARLTPSPTFEPTLLETLSPTFAMTSLPSPSPSLEPTLSPISAAKSLCVNFQYVLTNDANLTAKEIFNEVDNTLKTGLLIATEVTIVKILNESFPTVVTRSGFFSVPDLQHQDPIRDFNQVTEQVRDWISLQKSYNSVSDPENWVRRLPGLNDAVEFPAAHTLGDDEDTRDRKRAEMEASTRHTRFHRSRLDHRYQGLRVRQASTGMGHESGRLLVFYTQDLPAEISNIAEIPLSLCAGSSPFRRCAIVTSSVCVVLDLGNDEAQIRNVVVAGLSKAIYTGEFLNAIPPENKPSGGPTSARSLSFI